MSTFKAGLIGIVVIVVFTYLGFTKFKLPFVSQGHTVQVTFLNANQLRPGSLVRIAGVNVGQVNSIQAEPGCKPGDLSKCQAAVVTMTVNDQGLPIHKDATFAIRPRIFLEGNFFVDIRPGSPSAPVAPSDYVFPASQGTMPVQFDQVLSSLPSDTRRNLQILLQQYGTAVKQAGPSYNSSIQFWLPAYKYTSLVEHDALGTEPHDLSNWIDKQGVVSGALDAHPQNLQNLITDFNRTAAAFANQSANLQASVAELPNTLSAATPAFDALNRALCSGAAAPPPCADGPLPTLAKALIPAAQSTGPMIDASLPFITQLRLLVQPSELGGLTNDLSVTVPALAKLVNQTIPLMRDGVRPASSCVANQVIPWSQLTLNDPHFNASNGFPPHPVYVEAADFLPGLAGESRNFDSNGPYVRILGALGQTGLTSLQSGMIGGTLAPLAGFQPTVPAGGQPPPMQPTVPCETQPPITDLTSGSEQAPAPITSSTLSSVLGLLPLPNLPNLVSGLPVALSGDNAGKLSGPGTNYHPQSPQTLAAYRQQLIKTGLFERMVSQTPTPPPRTAARTNAHRNARARTKS